DLPISIFDEPSTGLDQRSKDLLSRVLQDLKADRIVIVVSHLKDVLATCDRIYELRPADHSQNVYECYETILRGRPDRGNPRVIQEGMVSACA
ncbi:MAG: hypothetical protein ACRD63_16815, partial [Pyrinomonadaceae bacterium]